MSVTLGGFLPQFLEEQLEVGRFGLFLLFFGGNMPG